MVDWNRPLHGNRKRPRHYSSGNGEWSYRVGKKHERGGDRFCIFVEGNGSVVKYRDVGKGSDMFCSSWVEYFHNEHNTVFSCGHGEWPISIGRDAEDWVENSQFFAACPMEEHSIFLDSIPTRKETA